MSNISPINSTCRWWWRWRRRRC